MRIPMKNKHSTTRASEMSSLSRHHNATEIRIFWLSYSRISDHIDDFCGNFLYCMRCRVTRKPIGKRG